MERVKRRWWTATVTVLASMVVLAAVLSGLFQLAVMALPGYREQLSDYVSRVADRPIDIGGIALVWYRLRPQLELNDITLYADDGETPALTAERLRIGFGLFRLLRGDTFPDQIGLAGLQVVVEVDRDNRLHLRGFDTAGRAKSTHDWRRDLARFDSIVLEDCSFTVDDALLTGGVPRFRLVSAEARRRIGGASLEASIELPRFMGESVEFDGRIEGDLDKPEEWEGRWSASVEKLARLPWLEARLAGHPRLQFDGADLSLRGTVQHGVVDTATLEVQADSVSARRGDRRAHVSDLALVANAQRNGASWALEVPSFRLRGDSGTWPSTRLRFEWTPLAGGGSEIEADADYLRLQDLAPWAMLPGDASTARLAGVTGELRALVGRARLGGEAPTYSVRAQLDGLGYQSSGSDPGFSGLRGEISATEAGGQLTVAAQPFELRYGRVFAQPVGFERLDGRLSWTRDAEGWRIDMPAFGWALAGSQGQGDLKLLLPSEAGRSPEIKLGARFSAADATRLKPYMPVYWGKNLHDWLDRAIVSGRVPHGQLDIQGRLADFPFKQDNGVFALDIDVADGRLAYAPNWPVADQVAARLQFRAGSLSILADSGRLSGTRVSKLTATIPDFQDAQLTIDGQVDGDAARYYDFLRNSPLAPRLSGLLNRTQASGPAGLSINIRIPLKDAAQTAVAGTATLNGVDLDYSGLDEPFKGIAGSLYFTTDGVTAHNATGTLYGVPVVASLTPQGKGATRLTADADYQLQPGGEALSRYVPALLRPYLAGGSHFRASILLGPGSDGLSVTSDLRGVAVSLPAPLGKPADEAMPLTVHVGDGPPATAPAVAPARAAAVPPVATAEAPRPLLIGVSYGDRAGVAVQMDHTAGGAMAARRVLVRAGSGEVPTATENGVRVIGQVGEIDVPQWIAVVRRSAVDDEPAIRVVTVPPQEPPAAPLRLQSIDLATTQMLLYGHRVAGAHFGLRPNAAGGWSIRLSGDNADGTLEWNSTPATETTAAASSLQARFARLRLSAHEPIPPDSGAKADTAEPMDPNGMPTVDVDVADLQVGAARLGRVQLLSERVDGGQRLAKLQAGGADLDLTASGDWLRRAGASTGRLGFQVESRAIAPLLQGLGYAQNLAAEKSQFEGDLSWPLSVSGLDWAMSQGRIDLDIAKGQLRAVEPGAGRVLGLLNFYALPRRLTLDFRDVTSKGLGFDRVHGTFTAGGGNANTDDLLIESPSLKIELRGRVGLLARDYDQRIKIYPDVSGGVTLGALLLGGPALGAIALVAQEVLDKPLDQVTQLKYQVTGNWDNPQVKRAD